MIALSSSKAGDSGVVDLVISTRNQPPRKLAEARWLDIVSHELLPTAGEGAGMITAAVRGAKK